MTQEERDRNEKMEELRRMEEESGMNKEKYDYADEEYNAPKYEEAIEEAEEYKEAIEESENKEKYDYAYEEYNAPRRVESEDEDNYEESEHKLGIKNKKYYYDDKKRPPKQEPNIVDGYKKIDLDEMPNGGVFYPHSWRFAYRCPTTLEVANFSTIQENDTPAIVAAVEDLIRKCVKIWDVNTQREVSSTEINDGDKLFFMLKIRSFYIPGQDIRLDETCDICHEVFEAKLTTESIQYKKPTDKLVNAFDGRLFTLNMGLEEPIVFRIPTIGTSARLFKYVVKVMRQTPDVKKDPINNTVHDKTFLLIAPWLFVTGQETIKEIMSRFKQIQKDSKLLNAYLSIVNNIQLDNLENIEAICSHCGSEVSSEIRFPGGWKHFFESENTNEYW